MILTFSHSPQSFTADVIHGISNHLSSPNHQGPPWFLLLWWTAPCPLPWYTYTHILFCFMMLPAFCNMHVLLHHSTVHFVTYQSNSYAVYCDNIRDKAVFIQQPAIIIKSTWLILSRSIKTYGGVAHLKIGIVWLAHPGDVWSGEFENQVNTLNSVNPAERCQWLLLPWCGELGLQHCFGLWDMLK